MIQFDYIIFSKGLKPPTSLCCEVVVMLRFPFLETACRWVANSGPKWPRCEDKEVNSCWFRRITLSCCRMCIKFCRNPVLQHFWPRFWDGFEIFFVDVPGPQMLPNVLSKILPSTTHTKKGDTHITDSSNSTSVTLWDKTICSPKVVKDFFLQWPASSAFRRRFRNLEHHRHQWLAMTMFSNLCVRRVYFNTLSWTLHLFL